MILIFASEPPLIRWCLVGETGAVASGLAGGGSRCWPRIEAEIGQPGDLEGIVYVLQHGGSAVQAELSSLSGDGLAALEGCQSLWPDANGLTLHVARTWLARRPDVPHWLACETGFFAGLPAVAQTYALPAALRERGLRRYGGDGLCHAWAWQQAVERFGPGLHRLVSIHIGDTPSVAAIQDGQPVDSSIGFTPVEGILSATGPGYIDPSVSVLLYQGGTAAQAIGSILRQQSGLTALAGRPCRLDEVLSVNTAEAALARRMLRYQIVNQVGACLAALDGAQALIFANEVDAEGAGALIAEVCADLAFLRVRLLSEGAASLDGEDLPALVAPYDRWQALAERVRALINLRSARY